MGGTGVVCRSVRKRLMREIYSPHSSKHSAQNTLKALNSLTYPSHIAGGRNPRASRPTIWLLPHLLLWLKCRTPSISSSLLLSLSWESQPAQLPLPFRRLITWLPELHSWSLLPSAELSKTCLLSLLGLLIQLCRTTIAGSHHFPLLSCYLVTNIWGGVLWGGRLPTHNHVSGR